MTDEDIFNTMTDLSDEEVMIIGRRRYNRYHRSVFDIIAKALTILMVAYGFVVIAIWTTQVSIAILFIFMVALAVLGIKQGKDSGRAARELLENVKKAAD